MFRNNSYFTVFGGSYVPERHADFHFEAERNVKRDLALSWVVLCVLVAGISVFAAEIAYLTGGRLFH